MKRATLTLFALLSSGCMVVADFDDYALGSSVTSSGPGGGGGGGGACDADLLIDPHHCGACGHSCLGGECIDGECQAIVIFENPSTGAHGTFSDIVVDAGRLYFIDIGDQDQAIGTGAVWSTTLDGTDALRLDTPGTTEPQAMALSSSDVFWTSVEGDVKRVPKSGGTTDTLGSGMPTGLRGIAVAGGDLFYADVYDILRIELSSGSLSDVVYEEGYPQQMAIDGADLYYTADGGRVARVPTDGSSLPEDLTSPQINPRAIALDATHVYWTAGDGIWRVAKTSGAQAEHLFTIEDPLDFGPWDIAVDDTHVYWTNWGPCLQSMGCAARPPSDELHGRVSRIPKAGGEREILAEGFLLPTGIALDDVAVYWTTWWFSSVMKRAK
ncbi:MAG TPA: hypothetical protein VFB62_27130 [Polyangiaceae bacterium]|nr:hypothetical protein [Polyangiaceae bacterium]